MTVMVVALSDVVRSAAAAREAAEMVVEVMVQVSRGSVVVVAVAQMAEEVPGMVGLGVVAAAVWESVTVEAREEEMAAMKGVATVVARSEAAMARGP